MTTELNKLANISDLPAYLDETRVTQTSSYDTTGNNDDGFSGKYSFVRKNPDGSLVIFEAKGNGVINRIWTPTPNNDTLDFYFEGSVKPNYSICFSDLFTGKVYPFIAPLTGNELGGYFSYVPIPFKNGCKITSRGKKMEFYQIQQRTYPANYQVKSFSGNLDSREISALNAVSENWNKVASFKGKSIHTENLLRNGDSITIADLNKGGRITGIRLHHADSFRGLNKSMQIRITWDDEDHPAVFMPVADFFGYAFGKESMQSLLLGSADNTNYCYFPMPFGSKAKIELLYLQKVGMRTDPVKISADVYFSEKQYEPLKEGKFYAFWNPEKKTTPGQPHLFLAGKGKGHYVGTILQAQGLTPGMTLFFEGDDVTTVDGKLTIHGTGSEDYFNGGWYALLDRWDRKMSLPLHGSLDYSLPYARTGGYRLFISDKMPFSKEIRHTIEHGPENNNKPGDYTSIAFYYASKSINEGQQKLPDYNLNKIYVPDTLMVYPQLMQYTISGGIKIEGSVFHCTNGGEVKIDLSDLPKGNYKLYADMEKSPDGAEIQIWQRQKLMSKAISFYAEKRESAPNSFLSNLVLDDFKNAITIHIKRDVAKSIVNIHRLILIKNHP
ncbi:glycoside hydrolase family 172 protein [Pedobacter frigoris]|nr:glycoside hydrolase family 172 protein [Pedobacter frigoris]